MSFVSRGFHGRRREDVDAARVPPGQYVTPDYPVLSAGPTPRTPLESWNFSIVGEVDETPSWSWDEFRALPSEESHRRHSLCDEVVEARHALARRVDRHAARRRADLGRIRDPVQRRRLHDQRPAGRTSPEARRGSSTSTTASLSRPSTAGRPACSSPTSTSGRARSGSEGCDCRARTSRASGRPTATTTTATRGRSSATGATDLAARGRPRSSSSRTPASRRLLSTSPSGRGTRPASMSTCA